MFDLLTPIELTEDEGAAFARCERTISEGLQTFYAVGNALAEIRDERLYRATHDTFEDYCQDRWGISRIHAYRLMSAATTVESLLPIGNTLPSNEAQVRPITGLSPDQQREVWQRAIETAPNGKVTAAHVEQVKEQVVPRNEALIQALTRFVCACGERFDIEVWHCPVCNHHWQMHRDECLNCHEYWRSDHDTQTDIDDALDPPMEPAQAADLQRQSRINAGMFSSETPEWYTPDLIIKRVLDLFGEIDLDPCSNSADPDEANIPANDYYTAAIDGLAQRWHGRVYMNPPYGDDIPPWIDRLVQAYEGGEIDEAIALLPARTDTNWFQPLWSHVFCFIKGRLKFKGADGGAPFPSVVVYMGPDVDGFKDAFNDIGAIVRAA